MSEDGADLHVPPEALAAIAKGIDLAHAELKDLGMVGEASAGRGFSDLGLSGLELGHGGLASEFRTFCDRWEWGVRALTQKGNNFALGVGLSAGAFAEQEQYVKDSFKIGVNSLNGNPHLSRWDTISGQTPRFLRRAETSRSARSPARDRLPLLRHCHRPRRHALRTRGRARRYRLAQPPDPVGYHHMGI
ncbi:hypothetical protein ACFYYY_24105 [Streptomyces sp. NPDC001834]|uniref:hypothetical protein n=1 Tax=Streptomyces sp. NPDC001834 TaxID=3364616 RepID=UPI0036BE5948